MALINSPPATAPATLVNGELAAPPEGWRNFFNAAYNICNALTQSGTTAQRPIALLWVGRPFFDTTLGIPIWILTPVPGPIWVDATGAVV